MPAGLPTCISPGLATDRLQKPVELAVDLRVQHALRDELIAARARFKAVAAAGVLTDVRTGEVVSMVSVPDYDPNNPREALDPTRINRLTTGVFEMGSTFKALTVAMALDSGQGHAEIRLRCQSPRCNTGNLQFTTSTRRAACLRFPRSSRIPRTSALRVWR